MRFKGRREESSPGNVAPRAPDGRTLELLTLGERNAGDA
jgi:hypothetical protein